MATASKTAKLVITSVVISIIVLAVFSLLFIRFIVPAYQITEDQIYSVLTKLFPVLIGLILIQIGVMVAKKGEPEYKDTIVPPIEKEGVTINSRFLWIMVSNRMQQY